MKSQAGQIGKTILSHLKQNDQLSLLGEIVEYLKSSSEFKSSQNRVVVTSAIELSASELKTITAYLDKNLGKGEYYLIQNVESSLLAGFTLQINDTLIDASVLGKINSVSNILTAKE